jgi:surface antigen
MDGRATSYTGVGPDRQSPGLARAIAVAVLAAALGGCSSVGVPFGEGKGGRLAGQKAQSQTVRTAADAIDQVDPSDWETIRRSVAAASETTSHSLSWRNPDTGSSGAIAVLPAISKAGSLCRSFAATVNDIRGIHRYGGEACLRTDGRWQLLAVTADDLVLS